jgi:hypothetical protein
MGIKYFSFNIAWALIMLFASLGTLDNALGLLHGDDHITSRRV